MFLFELRLHFRSIQTYYNKKSKKTLTGGIWVGQASAG